MIRCLIQRNFWRWELILFLSLVVTIFISSGCLKQKPKNELIIPTKFEVERFYDSGYDTPGIFCYTKISKDKTISAEYFSTPIDKFPDSWLYLTEHFNDRYCPRYTRANLTLDEFKEFWRHFQEINLMQLPNVITAPGHPRFRLSSDGMLRFHYIETEGNKEEVSKQLYIRQDGGEWWDVYGELDTVIKATHLILAQVRFAPHQVYGIEAVETIKPKLLEIYYSTNDLKETGMKRPVIEALVTLGEIKDPKAVIPLIKDLRDSNMRVRSAATWLLGELRDYRAVESLIDALGDRDEEVNKRIAEALIKITGHNFDEGIDIEESALWRNWWKENKEYIYWSDKEKKSLIDEEAKKAGISTGEYRKTHPWPKEDKPKEPDKPNDEKPH